MNKILIPNLLFILIVLITATSIYSIGGNSSVLLSNFAIILLALLFMIFGDKYNFSLNKVFMLFVFFFFGIAPAIQYLNKVTLWWGDPFKDRDYVRQNIIIIIIILLYQSVYYFGSLLRTGMIEECINRKLNKPRLISSRRILLISLVSLAITLIVYRFNIVNLLFRSGQIISMEQSVYLIYANFVRPIPVIALVYFKQYGVKNKKAELVLILTSLITNFPTAVPRFFAAAMYIPLFIIYYKDIQTSYLKLNRLLIYGFMLIFPLLDQFRRIASFTDARLSLDFRMFMTEHFDSFQMFMRVMNEKIITNGRQLLSSLLFFVPRAIWPEKSIGSGALVAEQLEFQFTNVSMNFFGEGYINFGYAGIVLFTVLLALLNARMDKLYWQKNNEMNITSIYYYFLLGLVFFVLRGDLMSSFAFSMGIFACVVMIQKICTIVKIEN